ncbi:D-hexose-6-phosphate mutarotase [bacterium]|nr:D-hexose-6-phosphate mutarotase [bacterium]MBU1958549.1 D-hexose-6-phosphate mutarotase [bacterium]
MILHKELNNGFKYIEVKNAYAEAKIALQGAHIFHYQVQEKAALLWVSEKAFFEKGKAIRGGIPICFPWFGLNKNDATLPQHGFARTAEWRVVIEEELNEGTTHVQLQLKQNEERLKLWAYHFDVRLDVVVDSKLSITLSVTNTDTKAFELSTALHSYFTISAIKNVVIRGLEKRRYYDSLLKETCVQEGTVVINEEVDRVYFDTTETVLLEDEKRTIAINQEGSNSMVLWNPWIEKSKQMADMTDDGYQTMVCLETANALEDTRMVQPNETHILKAVIDEIDR